MARRALAGLNRAEHYAAQLAGSGADAWLAKRGLWAVSIIEWKLGYVRVPLPGDEDYVGCLTIPYFDGLGRERGMRFRPLYANPVAKYLSRDGERPHLFAPMYTEYPRVYIAEGELDAITLWQTGRKAVGIQGTNAWRNEWRWLFRHCEEVALVFDNDPEKLRPDGTKVNAGQLAASKLYRDLEGLGLSVRNVKLPVGYDVNALYVADRARLEKLLEGRP